MKEIHLKISDIGVDRLYRYGIEAVASVNATASFGSFVRIFF